MSDIVVCKYCKFFKPRKGTSKGKCTSDSSGNKNEIVYEKSFCAFGDRKGEKKTRGK